MSNRVGLRIYRSPGWIEATVAFRTSSGAYHWETGIVDTGANVTLLPSRLTQVVEVESIHEDQVTIEQAGIAAQQFRAAEGTVWLYLEDYEGNRTPEIKVPVWFAESEIALLGFQGLLDLATLNLELNQLSGWIELYPEEA